MKLPRGLKIRISLSFFLLLFLFAVIFARFLQLQVIESPSLKRIAERQHKKIISLTPQRGTIYDREMRELALSIDSLSLYAHPGRVDDPHRAASTISRATGKGYRRVVKALSTNRPFVWIKRELSDREVERLKGLDIEGIGFVRESKRVYAKPPIAPHVIGFAGIDSQGLEGIELYYDSYLRSEKSRLYGYKDARGREIFYNGLDRKQRGYDLVLTIDSNIQYIAQKALREAVERYRAKSGFVIVMDPNTGEILAMANEPSFDPNSFFRASPSMWRNRAITDIFEPGSTFKVFLAAAAIEEGKVRPSSRFYCEKGAYRVADRIFHDYKRFGWLSFSEVLQYSSNIGAIKIAERLGVETFYRYLRLFGFGVKTGIDLPGEASGILRSGDRWTKVDLASIAFGQGVSVTGIQLLTAFSAIANGGYLLRPFVVKRIVSPDGRIVKEVTPYIRRRVISEETARTLSRILRKVVDEGTGSNASVEGYTVAGKTGTAQKVDSIRGGYLKDRYISSFIGYAPVEHPRISILVVIEEPEGSFYGGEVAAPVFREIAGRVLPYLGIDPDGRLKRITVKTAKVVKGAGRMEERILPGRKGEDSSLPSFIGKGIREVLREAWSLSLDVKVVGYGRAVAQDPKPGSPFKRGDSITVYFDSGVEKSLQIRDNSLLSGGTPHEDKGAS